MQKDLIPQARELSKDFVAFNAGSPSPYHAVAEGVSKLKSHGFQQLDETQNWNGALAAGGKYFIVRGGSSLIAFTVGKNFDAQKSYFKIVGAHTDSPCLRLAPQSKHTSQDYHLGYIQTYGGGLWHTWLDRDLIVAGRVLCKTEDGKIVHRLYRSSGAVTSADADRQNLGPLHPPQERPLDRNRQRRERPESHLRQLDLRRKLRLGPRRL